MQYCGKNTIVIWTNTIRRRQDTLGYHSAHEGGGEIDRFIEIQGDHSTFSVEPEQNPDPKRAPSAPEQNPAPLNGMFNITRRRSRALKTDDADCMATATVSRPTLYLKSWKNQKVRFNYRINSTHFRFTGIGGRRANVPMDLEKEEVESREYGSSPQQLYPDITLLVTR